MKNATTSVNTGTSIGGYISIVGWKLQRKRVMRQHKHGSWVSSKVKETEPSGDVSTTVLGNGTVVVSDLFR
jgi:hypothetical protein